MTSPLEGSVRQLLAWGLVDDAAIVAGDLKITSAARRNLNLRLERRGGTGYFIKQAAPDPTGATDSLAREARFYAFCAEEPRTAAMARLLPRLHAAWSLPRESAGPSEGQKRGSPFRSEEADGSATILVLELLQGVRTLWEEYRDQLPSNRRLAIPLALGFAIGTLHVSFRAGDLAGDSRLGTLDRDCPSCFDLHRPHPAMLRDASRARIELCRAIQREPEVVEGLIAARKQWRGETLIHGDIRLDNVLCRLQDAESWSRSTASPGVWLVDWEFVQHGDPAWDLGCALHDHLMVWLRSLSMRPDLDSTARLATARYPLEAVLPAIGALWTGYRKGASLEAHEASELLPRAVHFSGVRLLQTAWEKAHVLERQSTLGVLALQLGVNLLADPARAMHDLYGFGEPDRETRDPL